ncbi:MAG: SpoIIE family protein phosphatase [Leptospiraceae bacterium]|nr:SpoIIE family protein phosphatase [Leptospiraceae bacterium]
MFLWRKIINKLLKISIIIFLIFFQQCSNSIVRPELELLESNELDINQLESKNNIWKSIGKEIPNFGIGVEPKWVRIKIENTEFEKNLFVIEIGAPWLDRVDLIYRENEKVVHKISQELNDFNKEPVIHRTHAFELPLQSLESKWIYLRVANSGLVTLPLRIWKSKDFYYKSQAEYLIHGIYFGVMLSFLFYNLFVFFTVRELSYLFYCLYIVTAIILYSILGGFIKQYSIDYLNMITKPILISISFLGIGFILLFSILFLELKRLVPKLYNIVLIFAIMVLSFSMFSFFIETRINVTFLNIAVPLTIILILVLALVVIRKGFNQGIVFLIGWISLMIGSTIESLTTTKILPYTDIGRFGTQIGTLIEVLLFSIALGRRIKILTDEKAGVQTKLLILEQDLEIARRIQSRILPTEIPEIKGAEIHITYKPLLAVGGDFYDFHVKSNSEIGIIIADVTGHGVSAALDSSTVKIGFQNQKDSTDDPSAVLAGMNHFIHNSLKYRYLSAAYIYLDLNSNKLTYSLAGHPPIILVRNSIPIVLETGGMLLGVFSEFQFEKDELTLKEGDILVLYTDGLNENMSIDKNPTISLMEAIDTVYNKNLENFSKGLIDYFQKRINKQHDDVTLLLIQIH